MVKAKVREKYEGLSHQKLIDKAYELGSKYDVNSHSCSQSVVKAIHELLEIDDLVVKVATSLAGGTVVNILGTCGALSGGVIALDYFFGRPAEKMSYEERIEGNIDAMNAAFEAPKLLIDKFWKEYGAIHCAQIQRQLFGRFFWLQDADEFKKIEAAGTDKCGHIVGTAARWVMEILLDKGAVDL